VFLVWDPTGIDESLKGHSPRLRQASALRGLGLAALGGAGTLGMAVAQALDLWDLHRRLSPTAPDAFYEATPSEASQAAKLAGGQRIYVSPLVDEAGSRHGLSRDQYLLYLRKMMVHNVGMVDHLKVAGGRETMRSARFNKLWGAIHQGKWVQPRQYNPWNHPAFPLFATSLVVLPTPFQDFYRPAVHQRTIQSWPRAVLVAARGVPDSHAALEALVEKGLQPLPVEEENARTFLDPRPSGRVISFEEDSRGRVRILLDQVSRGWLFLSQAFDPGLRAVSGTGRRRIRPAAVHFCAIEIQRGDEEIRVDFQPSAFFVGFFLTCLGMTMAAALVMAELLRGRRAV